MHVISKKPLRDFWETHADADAPLRAWFHVVDKAEWTCWSDLRATYGSADQVGKYVVFNIGGNKYRLVVTVNYQIKKVYVRGVLTHKDYDDLDLEDGTL